MHHSRVILCGLVRNDGKCNCSIVIRIYRDYLYNYDTFYAHLRGWVMGGGGGE